MRKEFSKALNKHGPWVLIALLAGFMRCWYLDIFPRYGIDTDIYTYLADGFWEGRHEMFVIPYSYIPHPPLFFAIGNLFTWLFGSSIYSLRLLTAFCGVLASLSLYFIGCRIGGRKLGIISGLALALFPTAVYYDRIGYGYALLSFILIASFLYFPWIAAGRGQVADRQVLVWSLLLSLSMITEIGGLFFLLGGLVYVLLYQRKYLGAYVAGAAVIPGATFFCLWLRQPRWFWADLGANAGRAHPEMLFALLALIALILLVPLIRSSLGSIGQFIRSFFPYLWPLVFLLFVLFVPADYANLVSSNHVYWFGIIGLLLLPKEEFSRAVIISLCFYLFYQAYINRADRMIIPLFPVLALGIGQLWLLSWQSYKDIFSRRRERTYVMRAAAVVFAVLALGQTLSMVHAGAIVDGAYARDLLNAASHIAAYSDPDTLVVLGSPVGFLLDTRKATISQYVYYNASEQEAPYVSVGEVYDRERCLYPLEETAVDHVVWDTMRTDLLLGKIDPYEYYDKTIYQEDMVSELKLHQEKFRSVLKWPSRTFGSVVVFSNPK